jgi:quercetin dioxygenase-like cupin family protein
MLTSVIQSGYESPRCENDHLGANGGLRGQLESRRLRVEASSSGGDGMQLHPGVFVSNVATDDWRPDPEVGGGAEEHVLFETEALRAGLSRFPEDPSPHPIVWTLPATEVLFVLEGEARIQIEDGPLLELKPGDLACLPKGAVTTWHLTLPFKEMWVLAG